MLRAIAKAREGILSEARLLSFKREKNLLYFPEESLPLVGSKMDEDKEEKRKWEENGIRSGILPIENPGGEKNYSTLGLNKYHSTFNN